jgi:serine/threonine protein kinase
LDSTCHRQVASKVLVHGDADEEEFLRELEMLENCRHVNVVPFIGFCKDGQRALIMLFLEGLEHCLASESERATFDWYRRVSILVDVATALAYLHKPIAGLKDSITHRDIKPDNVMLADKQLSHARLGDLGCARSMQSCEVFTFPQGTDAWLDPEYLAENRLTTASDMCGFGLVALQLLTGRRNVP